MKTISKTFEIYAQEETTTNPEGTKEVEYNILGHKACCPDGHALISGHNRTPNVEINVLYDNTLEATIGNAEVPFNFCPSCGAKVGFIIES